MDKMTLEEHEVLTRGGGCGIDGEDCVFEAYTEAVALAREQEELLRRCEERFNAAAETAWLGGKGRDILADLRARSK